MKKIGITSLILAFASALSAIYLQFIVHPKAVFAEHLMEQQWTFSGETPNTEYFETISFQTDFAIFVMLFGTIALLTSIFALIKKYKMAWLGIVLSLGAAIIGAAYGTHMFS